MLNNVKQHADVIQNVTDVKKINVISFFKRRHAVQTLETRVVEPFSLYMSKKITPVYIYKFLSFYGSFFPLYRGLSAVGVIGLEATPC
jgi:hypothetical protein